VVYKGEILPGEQVPIVDRELFEAVQVKLAEQQNNHTKTRAKSEALLTGLIFDDRGNRMTPSHARKKGTKYRYYVSLPLLQGQPDRVGSVHRVPAIEIEKLIGDALRCKLEVADDVDQGDVVKTHLNRVEVQPRQLVVELKAPTEKQEGEAAAARKIIQIPWTKPPSKRRREIIVPESKTTTDTRPIRADARARLVAAIARGRRWLDELAAGDVSDIETLADRERCSVRKVNMTLSLAFLAPDLVKAAIEGRLPRGIGIARLCDPPAEWSHQYAKLGLARA
jgi:site-specific DNA recombinase